MWLLILASFCAGIIGYLFHEMDIKVRQLSAERQLLVSLLDLKEKEIRDLGMRLNTAIEFIQNPDFKNKEEK